MNEDRLLIMRAFGAEKRATDMLGVGPSDTKPKSGAITKTTGPMSGGNAISSLIGYRRGTAKTTSASVNEQNAKKPEEEQEETKPGVERLESASDTPAKKAPPKKPEEPSENEVDYEEKTSGIKELLTKNIAKIPFTAFPVAGGIAGGVSGGMGEHKGRVEQLKNILMGILKGGLVGTGAGAGYHAGALAKWAPNLMGATAGGLAASQLLKDSSAKSAFFPGIIGAGYGALRKTDPGESRMGSVGRSFFRDIATQLGAGTGAGLGMGLGAATKSTPLAILGLLLGMGGGGYGAYRLARDVTKRPLEEKEDARKRASFDKVAIGGAGLPLGLLYGALRDKDPGEDRLQSIGRSGLRGFGADVGSGIGGTLGGLGGAALGSGKGRVLAAILGSLLGGGVGAYGGYRTAKAISKRPSERPKKKEKPQPKEKEAAFRLPFAKAGADFGEDKGLSRTQKLLIGALAGAGVPVALWHGSGPFVRKLIEKIYKAAPLEKLYSLPQSNPRLAKALMYAPAGIGAAAGALSGGDKDEFKLAHVKLAAPDMRQLAADQPPTKDIIPYLGPLGGKVLSGLGGISSGIGLPGVGSKLEEWSQNPTARSIAGGGTTALAALLAALAARRLMRGRQDEAEE